MFLFRRSFDNDIAILELERDVTFRQTGSFLILNVCDIFLIFRLCSGCFLIKT